jgi:NTP pyrophosphatase (non-canonical NTP hydrolase)
MSPRRTPKCAIRRSISVEIQEYQQAAHATDQVPFDANDQDISGLMIPLLGLAGEAGSLLTEYKKFLRDKTAYRVFKQRVAEELGDILWYIANIATKERLDLRDIAAQNLRKVADRWHTADEGLFGPRLFDEHYPSNEQFPRQFEINLTTNRDAYDKEYVELSYQGKRFGDPLRDNAPTDDGYRFHDMFHLAYLTILGWAPVLRGRNFFDCKRKSNPDIDQIEDGGRATVIDEAISAVVFVAAKDYSFFEGANTVEYGILRTIKDLTSHLEVKRCSAKQWETAILRGFDIWRQVKRHKNGKLVGDLMKNSLEFISKEA